MTSLTMTSLTIHIAGIGFLSATLGRPADLLRATAAAGAQARHNGGAAAPSAGEDPAQSGTQPTYQSARALPRSAASPGQFSLIEGDR